MKPLRVVVGLGANLGDRHAALEGALRGLARVAAVVAVSPVYETAPVGGPPQGAFLNAAALLEWRGEPAELLAALLALEAAAGRERRERWGPRTLDLDILWINGVVLATSDLTVPHPRLTERAFALVPLLDVAPDAIDPRTGVAFAPLSGAGLVRQQRALSWS